MNKLCDQGRGVLWIFLLPFLALGIVAWAPAVARAAAAPDAAVASVLVLPFQINGGPEVEHLTEDLPELLAQRLIAKGLKVVPQATVHSILTARKVSALDVATVRALAREAGAQAAIYGTFSQVGETYSIDARVVSATGEKVKPVFVERQGAINLLPAVDDLAARVATELLSREVIAEVQVRGTNVLDPDVVLMRINTRKGDPIDPAAVDREVKRIWDLGYFSDVSASVEQKPEGLVLVYTVKEKPRIESIAIEGASEKSSDSVLEVMSSKAGSILNDKLLAQDIQKILELYHKDGYYLSQVDYRVDSRPGSAGATLVINITEGKKLYIKEVKIEGAEQMSASDVKSELALSERSMISWITGTGILKEELLERDSAAINAFYMNHGFMDVAVGVPKVDYQEDGIVITFPLKEGMRYKLGEVKFAGDLIDTDEVLYKLINLDDEAKDGGYFSLTVMQDDAKKITDYYGKYGYAYADVSPMPEKDASKQGVVNITYGIEKRQKVYIRRVVLEGNERTRDGVILREMRLVDGDQFDSAKLQRSMQRLNKLGYFDMAEAELVPTKDPENVDLKVKIKERSTGAIMAGVGYSTYSSFGVSGTISERNLWGKGYLLSLQAMLSGRRSAYTLSFTNPRYNDTNLSVGADLYNWRDDYYDYEKRTTGGTMRFAYPLGEYTSLGWGYRLDFYKLYDFDDDASQLIRDYEGNRVSSVLLARIIRDTTNAERPTSGTINRIGAEYGGGIIGGDDNFITLSAEHQTYYELMKNHVLHFRGKGSAIFENGDDTVPVFERFWMGGIDSVRGYRSKDIVPRDPDTGDRIGGTRMAFANFEYIWSVSPEFGLNLVPFFDIGFNIDADHDYNWSDEIKRSFGLELRWRSPMGDLRFSYGIPLDEDREGEKSSGRFEFSMGQFF